MRRLQFSFSDWLGGGVMLSTVLLSAAVLQTACAQNDPWPPPVWTQPTAPFHIAGPVYYVGGRELTAYLLADEACALLVNVGMEENVPLVLHSVQALGFKPQDIDYVLITQAHFDHAGGAQAVVQETGARVLAGAADVELLKAGGKGDYVFADELPFTAVPDAQAVENNERVQCGDIVVEALATPGHTPGSTSWRLRFQYEEQVQVALFAASVSVLPQAQLVGNPHYPQVVDDYHRSYQRLSNMQYDYYLPDHLVFIDPRDGSAPGAAWFRNKDALPEWIKRSREALEEKLEEEKGE